MSKVPEQFVGVTAVTKANIYFDGKVMSHAVECADGSKKTLGLIQPGEYHFSTQAAEKMEIVAGACRVVLDGSTEERGYGAGEAFEVPGNAGFTIRVADGICEYICSFMG